MADIPIQKASALDHKYDFTEDNYRKLLKLAKSKWNFASYTDYQEHKKQNICLWRHDIDYSLQRALALAKIEAYEGVKATYFILLSCEFYNPLDRPNREAIQEIVNLGHSLGVHFDYGYYKNRIKTLNDYAAHVQQEAKLLEYLFETPISVYSLHQPDTTDALTYDQDEIGGLINTYGQTFKTHYAYCSDSNGYWRFKRLETFLKEQTASIQVLTHPGWWQKQVQSPFERIKGCINGRAKNVLDTYQSELKRDGRDNIVE